MDTSTLTPLTHRTDAPFPSPFDDVGPHPLAREAALAVQDELRSGWITCDVSTDFLYGPPGGKMFGVLVTRDRTGGVHVLKAFSGQIGVIWELDGWAPPLFDALARQAIEPVVEARVKSLGRAIDELATSPEFQREREADGSAVTAGLPGARLP